MECKKKRKVVFNLIEEYHQKVPWLFERCSSHVRLFVRNFVDGLLQLIKQLDLKNDHNVVRTTKKEQIDKFCCENECYLTISLIEIGACSSV